MTTSIVPHTNTFLLNFGNKTTVGFWGGGGKRHRQTSSFSSCTLNSVYCCLLYQASFSDPYTWKFLYVYLLSFFISFSSSYSSHFMNQSDTPFKNWLILSSMDVLVPTYICDILSNLKFDILVGFNSPVIVGTQKFSFSHQLLASIAQQFTLFLAQVYLMSLMFNCHKRTPSLRLCQCF